jgi:hypothetical protein
MFKKYLLPIAVVLLIVPTFIEPAGAIPLTSLRLATAAPPSGAQPVYYYRGRGYYRGGPYRYGGAYRYGGRYYGGYWYGAGRRWYGGRWWPYGVGSCWRASPIGYVWVCG